MNKRNRVLAVLPLLALLGCEKPPANATAVFKPTTSIQEIMNSIVDPNIDYVWNSVSTISTAQGVEERSPKTDEEWKLVRQHALTVAEASNLLLIEGRAIAPPGASTSSHAVELSPEAIRQGIDKNKADFVQHAHDLHDATILAIKAIDEKNTEALVEAGGRIDQVCEQCHKQFWYPDDRIPTAALFAPPSQKWMQKALANNQVSHQIGESKS